MERHPEEKLQVAKVNLEAAILASQMTAMDIAKRYAMLGIKILPKDKWSNHRELACPLYQIACRADSCLGQFDDF